MPVETSSITVVNTERRVIDLDPARLSDPRLRASIRIGERMVSVATNMGLNLPQAVRKDSEWVIFNADLVLSQLLKMGSDSAKSVLKEVRNQFNGSQLNGDRQIAYEQMRRLMKRIGRSTLPPPLPPLPRRVVENIPS